MTKVLLIGEYYSSNLGDPVLCQVVRKHIEMAYPDTEVIPFDLSGKIEHDEYYDTDRRSLILKNFLRLSYRFPFLFKWSTLYKAYKSDELRYIRSMSLLNHLLSKHEFDYAIFAGGSVFMDYFAGIIYCTVKALQRKKVQVLFHACGVGKLDSNSIHLIRKAIGCRNVVGISLRDSCNKFKRIFRCEQIVEETFDSALMCSEFFAGEKIKNAEYGIGVIGLPQFYEFQKELVKFYMNAGATWKLFTNGSPSDELFARQILLDLGMGENDLQTYISARPTTVSELIRLITSFEKIVSFRMHSLIIAISYGIPNYGFVWDDKVFELYRKIGLENNCKQPNDEIDFSMIEVCLQYDVQAVRHRAREAGIASKICLLQLIERRNEGDHDT